MSKDTASGGTPPDSAEALTADIERTRHELGETVEALVAKANVKARARRRVAEVAGRMRGVPLYGVVAATVSGAVLLAWLTVRRRRR